MYLGRTTSEQLFTKRISACNSDSGSPLQLFAFVYCLLPQPIFFVGGAGLSLSHESESSLLMAGCKRSFSLLESWRRADSRRTHSSNSVTRRRSPDTLANSSAR